MASDGAAAADVYDGEGAADSRAATGTGPATFAFFVGNFSAAAPAVDAAVAAAAAAAVREKFPANCTESCV